MESSTGNSCPEFQAVTKLLALVTGSQVHVFNGAPSLQFSPSRRTAALPLMFFLNVNKERPFENLWY